ncbi:major capsid protein, partial [Mycobacterium alsense]
MADLTTSTTAAGWARDEYTFAPLDVVAPALINQCTMVSGDIEGDEPSLHVAYVVDQLDA